MSVVKYTRVPDNPIKGPEITHASSTTVDNDQIPLKSLKGFLNKPVWVVDYYSQRLGKTDPTLPHDSLVPDVLQQYAVIRNYQLRVENDLSGVEHTDDELLNVTGSAIHLGPNQPQAGDTFVAEVVEGRKGIFNITSVTKNSITKHPTYTIEYTLVRFTDTSDGARAYEDLESKVVLVTYYTEDTGCTTGSVVAETAYIATNEIKTLLNESISRYMDLFVDRESGLLLIPGNSERIYDPWITDFIQRTGDVYIHPTLSNLKQINLEDDPCLDQHTIWTALLYRDPDILPTCNDRVGLVNASNFTPVTLTDVVYWGWVKKVIYPSSPLDYEPHFNCKQTDLLDIKEVANLYPGLEFLVSDPTSDDIPRVLSDDYYIFSRNFYHGGMVTAYESLVINYIKKQKNEATRVVKYLKDSRRWGLLEQFYFTPIVWSLCREQI